MASYDTKVLANVGLASTNAGGNTGFEGVFEEFSFSQGTSVTSPPVALASFPIGVARVACRVVGIGVQLATPPTSGQINFEPVKIPCDGTGTPVDLCSTRPFIASTATGPAITTTFKAMDAVAGPTIVHSSTTGITDAILASVTFNQGDVIAITTTGTFTSAAGLCVTVYLQEQNGAY